MQAHLPQVQTVDRNLRSITSEKLKAKSFSKPKGNETQQNVAI